MFVAIGQRLSAVFLVSGFSLITIGMLFVGKVYGSRFIFPELILIIISIIGALRAL
tara:strand:+ start:627 stop:794 length:168 start_codon:yes stop_codon:yes gene_type:complete